MKKVLLALAAIAALPLLAATQAQETKVACRIIYVPTEQVVVEKMLEMARVKKDDVVFDLGCGDGRIPALACKKFGCRAVGIDLNPERIKQCMKTIEDYKVRNFVDNSLLEYRLGDALKVCDFDQASVVMLYMLPQFMDLLEPVAKKKLRPGTRIVSHDYKWRDEAWPPDVTVDFKEPRRSHTLYMWTVKDTRKKAVPGS
jgi:cyclopropane fatty-acyl-phospholipid synthase-like methyltransferase